MVWGVLWAKTTDADAEDEEQVVDCIVVMVGECECWMSVEKFGEVELE